MGVFWVVAPCSLVEVYRVSEMLAASIMALMMEATSTTDYTVQQLRRQPSS
jgi:hypothetical protein